MESRQSNARLGCRRLGDKEIVKERRSFTGEQQHIFVCTLENEEKESMSRSFFFFAVAVVGTTNIVATTTTTAAVTTTTPVIECVCFCSSFPLPFGSILISRAIEPRNGGRQALFFI